MDGRGAPLARRRQVTPTPPPPVPPPTPNPGSGSPTARCRRGKAVPLGSCESPAPANCAARWLSACFRARSALHALPARCRRGLTHGSVSCPAHASSAQFAVAGLWPVDEQGRVLNQTLCRQTPFDTRQVRQAGPSRPARVGMCVRACGRPLRLTRVPASRPPCSCRWTFCCACTAWPPRPLRQIPLSLKTFGRQVARARAGAWCAGVAGRAGRPWAAGVLRAAVRRAAFAGAVGWALAVPLPLHPLHPPMDSCRTLKPLRSCLLYTMPMWVLCWEGVGRGGRVRPACSGCMCPPLPNVPASHARSPPPGCRLRFKT